MECSNWLFLWHRLEATQEPYTVMQRNSEIESSIPVATENSRPNYQIYSTGLNFADWKKIIFIYILFTSMHSFKTLLIALNYYFKLYKLFNVRTKTEIYLDKIGMMMIIIIDIVMWWCDIPSCFSMRFILAGGNPIPRGSGDFCRLKEE